MMKRSLKILLVLAIITQIGYLIYRVIFTLPIKFGILSLLLSLILYAAEATANFQGILEFVNALLHKPAKEIAKLPDEFYPDVDVLVITHDEDLELIAKTLNGCKTLVYPDLSKIHVHVCDDTLRPEVAELAAKFGVNYLGLDPKKNKEKKAGNVNNALAQTSAPLVALLDCDMIPKSDFLQDVVPYFYNLEYTDFDEVADYVDFLKKNDYKYKLCYLQTAQDFYTLDLFQYNLFAEDFLPKEQDYFFKSVNPARTAFNAPIFCGSNAMLSREALKTIGGLSADSITEDLSTSIQLIKNGYQSQAIAGSYLYGMNPTTIDGLKIQRERWGRGFFQSMRANRLFLSLVPLRTKLGFLQSFNYWLFPFRRILFMLVPACTVIFNLRLVVGDVGLFMTIWGISYVLYNLALRKSAGEKMTAFYANIIENTLSPLIAWNLFVELFGMRETKFKITPKSYNKKEKKHWGTIIFLILAIVLNVLALISLFTRWFGYVNPISLFIISYWNVRNLFLNIFSLSFMKQRADLMKNFVMWELELPVQVADNTLYTTKLNEEYLYLKDLNGELPEGRLLEMQITSDKYQAKKLLGKYHGKKYRGLHEIELVRELDEPYLNYLNILHDREVEPTEVVEDKGFWFKLFVKNCKNLLIGIKS